MRGEPRLEGQASRFSAVLSEYSNAPDVTRERLYIETMERVLGDVSKIILDPSVTGGEGNGSGVVPFLPLDQLIRPAAKASRTGVKRSHSRAIRTRVSAAR